jgi:hypothetical protein
MGLGEEWLTGNRRDEEKRQDAAYYRAALHGHKQGKRKNDWLRAKWFAMRCPGFGRSGVTQ